MPEGTGPWLSGADAGGSGRGAGAFTVVGGTIKACGINKLHRDASGDDDLHG
jgi:hypothetical protein